MCLTQKVEIPVDATFVVAGTVCVEQVGGNALLARQPHFGGGALHQAGLAAGGDIHVHVVLHRGQGPSSRTDALDVCAIRPQRVSRHCTVVTLGHACRRVPAVQFSIDIHEDHGVARCQAHGRRVKPFVVGQRRCVVLFLVAVGGDDQRDRVHLHVAVNGVDVAVVFQVLDDHLEMQAHDAVATVGGHGLQDEVAIGGILLNHLDTGHIGGIRTAAIRGEGRKRAGWGAGSAVNHRTGRIGQGKEDSLNERSQMVS